MQTTKTCNHRASLVLLSVLGAGALLLAGCEGDGGGGSIGDDHDFGANNPDLYVAMGDSITAHGYPAILGAQLGATVVNRGEPGAWSNNGAAGVSGVLSRYKPGYLLILYGSNDAIHGNNPDVVAANLRAMIGAAKAKQTIPVIGTLLPMSGVHAGFAGNAQEISRRIRALASEQHVPLADLEKGFGNNPAYILPDGLHPTPAGSERIASIFYGAIR